LVPIVRPPAYLCYLQIRPQVRYLACPQRVASHWGCHSHNLGQVLLYLSILTRARLDPLAPTWHRLSRYSNVIQLIQVLVALLPPTHSLRLLMGTQDQTSLAMFVQSPELSQARWTIPGMRPRGTALKQMTHPQGQGYVPLAIRQGPTNRFTITNVNEEDLLLRDIAQTSTSAAPVPITIVSIGPSSSIRRDWRSLSGALQLFAVRSGTKFLSPVRNFTS